MPELLSRRQAAEQLGISLVTLDAERAAGRLAFIQRKPGGKVWISVAAINEYLAKGVHPAKLEVSIVNGTYRRRRS